MSHVAAAGEAILHLGLIEIEADYANTGLADGHGEGRYIPIMPMVMSLE